MRAIPVGSASHAVAGAIGALITLGLFACLSATGGKDASAAVSGIHVNDAAGRTRIFLGENSNRPGDYCLEFYSRDGRSTTFQLSSSDQGAEAVFYDQSEKINIWLAGLADGASLDLLSGGLGVVHLSADKAGQGALSIYKQEQTTIHGEPATLMHPVVKFPE